MRLYYSSLLALLSMAANRASAAICFDGDLTAAGSTTVYPVAVRPGVARYGCWPMMKMKLG